MLPCLGDDRWYPLTGQAGFFHAPSRVVRKKLLAAAGASARADEYADLSTALAALGPFPFRRRQTLFLLPSAGDTWTTVLSSAAPAGDVGYHLSTRAALDVGCDFVAAEWVPRAPGVGGAQAQFVDYRHERRGLFGSARPWHERSRTVQVTRQDSGWTFDALGPPRAYEEPAAYEQSRKAHRLSLPLLGRYAEAAGVAVQDPGWLDGPVHTITNRRPQPTAGDEETWTTPAELRSRCGYPGAGVPEEL